MRKDGSDDPLHNIYDRDIHMPYDTAKMRLKLQKMMSGRAADPNEFRVSKITAGNEATYRFFIMPPLQAGDPCANGTASKSMDMCWIPFGQHWIDQKPYACPRVASENEITCPMCDKGFALMKEAKAHNAARDKISAIARQWLPNQQNVVNIYFTNSSVNPDEYHGRVLYFKLPKACFNEFIACLQREDFGDAESPQAFGAFFDEMAGYLFELKVKCKDGYNNYEASRFLHQCRPMILQSDGKTPDIKRIQEAMDHRHDLYKVCDQPDVAVMKQMVKRLWDGDDSDDENGSGFTKDEVVESRGSSQTRLTMGELEPPVRSRSLMEELDPTIRQRSATEAQRPATLENPAPEALKANGKSAEDDISSKVARKPKPTLDDEDEVPVKPVRSKAKPVEEVVVSTTSSKKPPIDDVEAMLMQLDED